MLSQIGRFEPRHRAGKPYVRRAVLAIVAMFALSSCAPAVPASGSGGSSGATGGTTGGGSGEQERGATASGAGGAPALEAREQGAPGQAEAWMQVLVQGAASGAPAARVPVEASTRAAMSVPAEGPVEVRPPRSAQPRP